MKLSTGEQLDLSVSDNELARMLDECAASKSVLSERESAISRELAKRHPGVSRVETDDYDVTLRRYAHASRRLPANGKYTPEAAS